MLSTTRGAAGVLAAAMLLAGVTTAAASEADTARLAVTSVSNPRPNLVSDDDVLVRVTGAAGDVRVRRNGTDVTASFAAQPDGSLLGLVSGLRKGHNTITAGTRGGGAVAGQHSRHATLRLTNHPIDGPVFSGPQQLPFHCETTAFGLEPAVPPACAAPTVVRYQYRTTAGTFAPLADPTAPPADLATATVNGAAVPYIVRIETGTIDRAVYELAALYDGDPSPVRPEAGWNDRLAYSFGGGCNSGYHQGAATGGVVDDLFLSQGYAVASSSLNVLDNNCSPIISAEAAMMVKEHFAETYGPIRHTIGWGGSGGAIQQYDIADAYPGIVDGIIPGISYPDPTTVMMPVTDCGLLNAFFAGPGATFTPAQRAAVSGYLTYSPCVSWGQSFLNRSTATGSCHPSVPPGERWHPSTNPDGIKCNAAEQWVNQVGRDPRTGFVRAVLDNTGVQYGLSAVESGTITAAQFVALNAAIGGYDHTGTPIPTRTAADPRGLAALYGSDLVNSAGQGLRATPIIDQRMYLDRVGPLGDIHTAEMSYVMRARLLAANGTAANQVIISNQPLPGEIVAAQRYELDAMDRWLTAIAEDRSHRDRAAKVIANKPADLGDGCFLSATERILEPATYPATGRCGARFPLGANPRLVAGSELSMDVLKCRLHPLDFADYPVSFTAEEQTRLRQAFPTGVCDYDRPGVGQRPARGTWLAYPPPRN